MNYDKRFSDKAVNYLERVKNSMAWKFLVIDNKVNGTHLIIEFSQEGGFENASNL